MHCLTNRARIPKLNTFDSSKSEELHFAGRQQPNTAGTDTQLGYVIASQSAVPFRINQNLSKHLNCQSEKCTPLPNYAASQSRAAFDRYSIFDSFSKTITCCLFSRVHSGDLCSVPGLFLLNTTKPPATQLRVPRTKWRAANSTISILSQLTDQPAFSLLPVESTFP